MEKQKARLKEKQQIQANENDEVSGFLKS